MLKTKTIKHSEENMEDESLNARHRQRFLKQDPQSTKYKRKK